DERAGGSVDLLVAEDERRAAARDEVQLLVAVLLVVLLDDALRALLPGVRVCPEGSDAEPPAHRAPGEALVVDLDPVELVEVAPFVRLLPHVRPRSASSTTGSISEMPSTRSSRFSLPVQRVNDSSSSPS